MLPTPSTSHVPYDRVYEPAEDSFLLLDTLAAPAETAWLHARFGRAAGAPPPLVVEVGTGSGVVLAFVAAQAGHLFGRAVLALAVDVNAFACRATGETVRAAEAAQQADDTETKQADTPPHTLYLGAARADLVSALRPGQTDVLLFNPPYVPTPDLPALPTATTDDTPDVFARDSHLLALAYAGGRDGMETTDRLLAALPATLAPRGCAYVLLCAQNRPAEVKARVRAWPCDDGSGRSWQAETVGSSGKQAGWEKLQVVRIWRE